MSNNVKDFNFDSEIKSFKINSNPVRVQNIKLNQFNIDRKSLVNNLNASSEEISYVDTSNFGTNINENLSDLGKKQKKSKVNKTYNYWDYNRAIWLRDLRDVFTTDNDSLIDFGINAGYKTKVKNKNLYSQNNPHSKSLAKVTFSGDDDYSYGKDTKLSNFNLKTFDIASGEYSFAKIGGDIGNLDKTGVGANYSASFGYLSGGANVNVGIDHVNFSASGRVSAAHIQGQAGATYKITNRLTGKKMSVIGGTVSGSADALSANASVNGGLGLYKDKEGKTRLDAGTSIELGADLVSATGKAKVNLVGVKVGAEATVRVGVGLKANVGFKNGKFHLNLGAALGVGANVAVSFDVGEAVDNVLNTATVVAKGVADVQIATLKLVNSFVSDMFIHN